MQHWEDCSEESENLNNLESGRPIIKVNWVHQFAIDSTVIACSFSGISYDVSPIEEEKPR